MKKSKSISKVGWIPPNEPINVTWDATHCDQVKRNNLALSKREAGFSCKDSPRKVRVTLTLTVEDVK